MESDRLPKESLYIYKYLISKETLWFEQWMVASFTLNTPSFVVFLTFQAFLQCTHSQSQRWTQTMFLSHPAAIDSDQTMSGLDIPNM